MVYIVISVILDLLLMKAILMIFISYRLVGRVELPSSPYTVKAHVLDQDGSITVSLSSTHYLRLKTISLI